MHSRHRIQNSNRGSKRDVENASLMLHLYYGYRGANETTGCTAVDISALEVKLIVEHGRSPPPLVACLVEFFKQRELEKNIILCKMAAMLDFRDILGWSRS